MNANTFGLEGEASTYMLRATSGAQANSGTLQGVLDVEANTVTLAAEGGFAPGLIIPSVILLVALLATAAILIVTRNSGRRDDDER